MANKIKITPPQLRIVANFIGERVESGETAGIGARMLFDAYAAYCQEKAVRSSNAATFSAAMTKLGFKKNRHSCGFWYGGLMLKTSERATTIANEKAATPAVAAEASPPASVTLPTGVVHWLISGLDSAQKAAGKLAAISSAAMTTKELEYELGQSSVEEFFKYHFVDRDNLATLRDVTRTASEITSLKRELRAALSKAGVVQQPEGLAFQPGHYF
jgi:hypothetical protein